MYIHLSFLGDCFLTDVESGLQEVDQKCYLKFGMEQNIQKFRYNKSP